MKPDPPENKPPLGAPGGPARGRVITSRFSNLRRPVDGLLAHAPKAIHKGSSCQVISLRYVMSDKRDYVNWRGGRSKTEEGTRNSLRISDI